MKEIHLLEMTDPSGHKWLSIHVEFIFDGKELSATKVVPPKQNNNGTRKIRSDKGKPKPRGELMTEERKEAIRQDLAVLWPADKKTKLSDKLLAEIGRKHNTSATSVRKIQVERVVGETTP